MLFVLVPTLSYSFSDSSALLVFRNVFINVTASLSACILLGSPYEAIFVPSVKLIPCSHPTQSLHLFWLELCRVGAVGSLLVVLPPGTCMVRRMSLPACWGTSPGHPRDFLPCAVQAADGHSSVTLLYPLHSLWHLQMRHKVQQNFTWLACSVKSLLSHCKEWDPVTLMSMYYLRSWGF